MSDPVVAARTALWPFPAQIVHVAAGDPVFHEGDDAAALFVIESGVVMLHRTAADGSRLIHGLRFPGELIGLASGERYIVGAVARRPTTLRRIPRSAFERAIGTDPAVGRRLLAACTDELLRISNQLMVVGSRTALGRVAAFLLDVSEREAGGAATFALPISRAELGDALGLTIETVSRSMTRLKLLGVIDKAAGAMVTVRDRGRLRDLARGDGELARGRLAA